MTSPWSMRRIEPFAFTCTTSPDGLASAMRTVCAHATDSRCGCGCALHVRPLRAPGAASWCVAASASSARERDAGDRPLVEQPRAARAAASAPSSVAGPLEQGEARRCEQHARDRHALLLAPARAASSQSRSTSSPPARATHLFDADGAQHRGMMRSSMRSTRARCAAAPRAASRRQVGPLGHEQRSRSGGGRTMRPSPALHRPALARKSAMRAARSARRPARGVPATERRQVERLSTAARRAASAASGPPTRAASARRRSRCCRRCRRRLPRCPRRARAAARATAAYDEIGWNCVTISENAPSRCENAIADCVITPNSASPRMNSGATISAGMIWIR